MYFNTEAENSTFYYLYRNLSTFSSTIKIMKNHVCSLG